MGLVQFESQNCLNTSRSYVTIMHLVRLNLVIIGYINTRFNIPGSSANDLLQIQRTTDSKATSDIHRFGSA